MKKYPEFILNLIHQYSSKEIIKIDEEQGKYRFKISYTIKKENESRKLVVIMMNPSKANRQQSDNTINRLLNYANSKQYTELIVLNTLPVYLTDSGELVNEMISQAGFDKNLEIIKDAVVDSDEIVFATGNPVIRKGAESLAEIYKILEREKSKRFCGELTKMGYTKHLRVTSNEAMNKLIPLFEE